MSALIEAVGAQVITNATKKACEARETRMELYYKENGEVELVQKLRWCTNTKQQLMKPVGCNMFDIEPDVTEVNYLR